jgi:hypothetical protein
MQARLGLLTAKRRNRDECSLDYGANGATMDTELMCLCHTDRCPSTLARISHEPR